MRLRPMTRADLPACITISCDAYIDDGFFAWIAPHRREHPGGWRRYVAGRPRQRLVTPGWHCVVCVSEGSGGGEEVVGYAMWHRTADRPSAYTGSSFLTHTSSGSWSFLDPVERLLLAYEESYAFNVAGNAALDAKVAAMFRDSRPLPVFAPLNDHWHLGGLQVAPSHQRKGIGARLVAWGLERCREEGEMLGLAPPPAILIARPAGQELYARLGFKVVGWLGEEVDVAAPAMVWDGSRAWVRPVGEGDVRVSAGGRPIEVVYCGSQEEVGVRAAEERAGGAMVVEEVRLSLDGPDEKIASTVATLAEIVA